MLAVVLLSLSTVVLADGIAPGESARIEYLLTSIAALPDTQFVRNGSAYDAKAAVEHLRSKLRYAGSRVRTAEDFIRYCASESSLSGKPYEIRFSDGRDHVLGGFLRQKLLQFDTQNAAGGTWPWRPPVWRAADTDRTRAVRQGR
jgi:hypothetical protein